MQLPNLDRPITGVRVVFHPDPKAPGGGRGYGAIAPNPLRKKPDPPTDRGTFIVTAFSASADPVAGDNVNLNRLLGIAQVTADSWLPEWRPEGVIDTRGEDGWSPHPGEPASAGGELAPTHMTVTFDKPVDTTDTPFMTIQLNFGHVDSTVAARFEFLAMTGTDDGSDLPADIIAILEKKTPERTQAEQDQIRAYFAAHSDETHRTRTDLANLEERLRVVTEKFSTMVMDQSATPRETHILNRGDYSQPTEKVTAATPAVLPSLAPRSSLPAPQSSRLDLANWITMPENPLTARVAVNRIWQMLFGAGLVPTVADFGAQGEYPTHPELIDWLAVDFRHNGWDTKRLIKQIVMSATYRQSSETGSHQLASASGATAGSSSSADLLTLDPNNRLLARGPRFRLPAEFIRDSALKISGLMVDRLGGPSVNPYTPGNLWREISHYGSTPATSQTFEQDHGEKLYRRSLYTYWKRTVPPPNMVAFDAPNREVCTVARPSTTTPLQALVLLNDVQFVEASRAFAERILAQPIDETDRLRWAFEECVARPPTDEELSVLTDALFRERTRYTNDKSAAEEFLDNGESMRNEKIPAPEHAAWAQVAAMLLNLSETVTRN